AELRKYGQMLPTQSARTQEQEQFQQFSTPPTLAYIAARAAGIQPGELALEPSAGTGNLAMWARAAGADVETNEIAPRRAALLQEQGYPVSRVNAEHLDDLLPGDAEKPSLVIMNPPFSSTGGRVAKNDVRFGLDHVESALKRLQDGGRLVAIL